MIRSEKENVSVSTSVLPNVVNDDTDGGGVGVDLRGHGAALVVFHIGQSGDTLSGTVKLELRVQESADNSTWADVAAADLDGTQALLIDAAAEDEIVHVVGYKGKKRYLRAFVDTTGTHTVGTPCSAVVVRSLPTYAPTT